MRDIDSATAEALNVVFDVGASMHCVSRVLSILACSLFIGSCTSLFHVHDPQTGLISAGQIPGFLKSIRCEAITFYQIQRQRRAQYLLLYKDHPVEAFASYAYFNLDPYLYGTFTLELKVTDTGALGTATSVDYKRVLSATTSDISHIGPSLSGQGVYDLIWSFLLRQDATLASVPSSDGSEPSCYRGLPKKIPLHSLEALAENRNPELAAFNRIVVDGSKPLAAWLRDNAILLAAQQLSPAMPTESIAPTQMTYTFSITVSGGIEAKYSLISSRFSPLAAQASVSGQQFSNLIIYINGADAALANTAKAGGAGYGPKPAQIGSKENPSYVRQLPGNTGGEQSQEFPGNPAPKPRVGGPRMNGYIITPLTVFPPAPAQ